MAAFRSRRLAGCAAWLAPLSFIPPLHAFQREQLVVEEFGSPANWDVFATGAAWGPGSLRPGRVGDDGVLGDFVVSDGVDLGVVGGLRTFQWSTDQQVIPAERTLTGQAITVTDGVFRFASFLVPPGVHVVFRGSRSLQLRVAGVVLLSGTVDVSGEPTPDAFNGVLAGSPVGNRRGQPGATGGPGGGTGGTGGDHPGLTGGAVDGRNGQGVVTLPGHPYASTAFGTGGGGSLAHPAQGSAAAVQYCFATTFSRQIASGGGGGSLFATQLGGAGSAQNIPTGCTASILGPPSVGGTAFQLLPEVGTVSSRVQFLVGGAGGGAAGVNPNNSVRLQTIAWKPGGGGGGGGGAAVIAAGFGLGVLPGAAILAQGGRAGNPLNSGYACPGGGGSGGSLLLQAPLYYQGGLLDLGGGLGGTWASPRLDSRSTGGTGGAGYVRLESLVRPGVADLGTVQPPATPDNTGLLRDQDAASGARSLWFSTRGIVPTSARFRIDALEGGRRVVYSDDPLIGMVPVRGLTPIAFFLQGANVDPAPRNAQPGTQTPWVDRAASLLPYGRDGLRFAAMLDRSILGPSVAIEVLRVEVRLRG